MKPCLLALLLIGPLAAQAGNGVAAAVQAAAAVWPAAKITPLTAAAPCTAPVVADAPASARNGLAQVRVRCTAAPGWTRYVGLRIEQTAQVAVLRAPLAQGQPLSAEAIEWQPRDAMRLPADVLLHAGTGLPALTARRALPAGSVLARSQFAAPKAIQRGQAVTLISRAAGMEVRAPGEALADAALGMRVKVRNSASRRVVEGIAKADGTVEVTL